MVDVGYFINGRHGVIRNVMPISNTKTEHLCFIQADGEEQYALKKEDIEYVIPHDEECKVVHDEVAENYIKDALKSMTNAEKFKEVFGFEPNRSADICDVVDCSYRENCLGCPYEEYDYWDRPYMKVEVED